MTLPLRPVRPAGAAGQVQFNNAGRFGASPYVQIIGNKLVATGGYSTCTLVPDGEITAAGMQLHHDGLTKPPEGTASFGLGVYITVTDGVEYFHWTNPVTSEEFLDIPVVVGVNIPLAYGLYVTFASATGHETDQGGSWTVTFNPNAAELTGGLSIEGLLNLIGDAILNGDIRIPDNGQPRGFPQTRLIIGDAAPTYPNAEIITIVKDLGDQLLVTLKNTHTGGNAAGAQWSVENDAEAMGGFGISNSNWGLDAADGVAAHETFFASFGRGLSAPHANMSFTTQTQYTHVRFGVNNIGRMFLTQYGVGFGAQPVDITTPVFSGTGVNDFEVAGIYTGPQDGTYTVSIVAEGNWDLQTWDQFRVQGPGIDSTYNMGDFGPFGWFYVGNGLRMRFTDPLSHIIGDTWTFTVKTYAFRLLQGTSPNGAIVECDTEFVGQHTQTGPIRASDAVTAQSFRISLVADSICQFGMLVTAQGTSADGRFITNPSSGVMPIGIVTGDGPTAVGAAYDIAIGGKAYIVPAANMPVGRGDICHQGSSNGYGEFDPTAPVSDHWSEVGHALTAEPITYTAATAGVDLGNNTLTLASAPNWVVGEPVVYYNGGGASATGLTSGEVYWIESIAGAVVGLSATRGGVRVDISGTGNNAQYVQRLPLCVLHFN